MEPEVRKFLGSIVQIMSMSLLWMLVNTLVGIKLGYLFLDEEITVWHGLYYFFLLVSFAMLYRYIRKKFREMPSFSAGQEEEG